MPFDRNEHYQLPPLTSKAAILSVIHEVTQAQIRGVITPATAKTVLYSMQVALCVFNSNLPDNPPAPLRGAATQNPPTLEGSETNATDHRRKKQ